MTPLSEKKQTLNVYFFLTVDRENVQPRVIKLACSFRAVRVCLEIGDRLPHDRIFSEWFTSKPASRIV